MRNSLFLNAEIGFKSVARQCDEPYFCAVFQYFSCCLCLFFMLSLPIFTLSFFFSCYKFLFFSCFYLLIFYAIAQNVNILTNEIHDKISVRKYAILADFAIA